MPTLPRPTSLTGLLLEVMHQRRLLWPLLVLLILLTAMLVVCLGTTQHVNPESGTSNAHADRARARLASFNIEFFPKNTRQIEASFEVIKEIDASAVGLQEITRPDIFIREAKKRLGTNWEFVYQDAFALSGNPKLHIGLLFDRDVFELLAVRSREETQVTERTLRTLEVHLRHHRSGADITLLVLHFKSMPEGRDLRVRQFAGLRTIIDDLKSKRQRLVVMGDFNATEEGDRDDLLHLATRSDLVWTTEDLPCSAFWERAEDCPTSRLDHVLAWTSPTQTVARGGCDLGCERRNSCPLYRYAVSDHCPVVIDIADLRASSD